MLRKFLKRLNLVDWILLSIVAISLLASAYKLISGKGNNELQSFQLTCICTSAPLEIYDGIIPDMVCSEESSGKPLGTLVSLTLSETSDHERSRGTFILTAAGKKEENGILINKISYLKGKPFWMTAGDAAFEVYLSEIQPLD